MASPVYECYLENVRDVFDDFLVLFPSAMALHNSNVSSRNEEVFGYCHTTGHDVKTVEQFSSVSPRHTAICEKEKAAK